MNLRACSLLSLGPLLGCVPTVHGTDDNLSSSEASSGESTSETETTDENETDTETTGCEPTMCATLVEQAQALAGSGFSGALGVVREGEVLLWSAHGECVRDPATPCDTEAVFDIGSITKQFTAAAIMALVEDGQLAVEDTLADHLPMVPPDKAEITIHQLLTHTAGVPEAIGDDYDPLERDAFLAQVLALPLEDPPGQVYAYSNVGYSLLTAVIEVTTGMSYEEYLRERLFVPAGMLHTGYVLPDFAGRTIAHGYSGMETIGAPNELPWAADGPYWNLRGNGGLLSTLDDMAAWSEALRGDVVLSAASKTPMFTPWVDEGFGDTFYGYGWVLPVGEEYATHNGGNLYFFADYFHYLETDMVVIVLDNAFEFSHAEVGNALRAAALDCPLGCE